MDFMDRAIELAKKAKSEGEIPVGAVVVKNGEIIGEGYNKREGTSLATAHAEILAIEDACKKLGDWRLNDCTLYVTLEPCPMCTGAILMSRLDELVFGAYSPDGAVISRTKLTESYGSKMKIVGGYRADECGSLIDIFD